jgi:hypothetical protein
MAYEPLESSRADSLITVEPAPAADTGADWKAPVLTQTERHRCPHRLRFRDLNGKGRVKAAAAFVLIVLSWTVIAVISFFGAVAIGVGFGESRAVIAVSGLLLSCSAVLQPFGLIALARVWKRPHRPNDVVIGLAVVGFVLYLVALVLLLPSGGIIVPALGAVPLALVLRQLISFRGSLYGRDSCRTHPVFPPAILALLTHDPGPLEAVKPEPGRFRVRDCPHRIGFGELRVRYRVASVVNSLLLAAYVAMVIILWAEVLASASVAVGGSAFTADVFGFLVPLGNLCSLMEILARSKRYHRASPFVSVGAFVGYGSTLAAGLWLGLSMPVSLVVIALTAYWAYSAAYAMRHLPPRSECASLSEPPLVIQRMRKA